MDNPFYIDSENRNDIPITAGDLAGVTTDDLAEGVINLYFTTGRAQSAIQSTTPTLSGLIVTGASGIPKFTVGVMGTGSTSTSDLPEGSNPYFSTTRSRDSWAPGTGYTSGWSAGDMGYMSGSSTLARIPLGPAAPGDVLMLNGSYVPTWSAISASGVVSLASTGANITVSTPTGAVTITLNPSPTLTGLTVSGLSGVGKFTAGVLSGSATTNDVPEGPGSYYATQARVRSYVGPGTGYSGSWNVGDLLYISAAGTLAARAIGTVGYALFVNGSSLPEWRAIAQADVSGLTTASTPSFASIALTALPTSTPAYFVIQSDGIGTIGKMAAPVPTLYGGTGRSGAYTLNGVVFADTTTSLSNVANPSATRKYLGQTSSASNAPTFTQPDTSELTTTLTTLVKGSGGVLANATSSDYVATVAAGAGISVSGTGSGPYSGVVTVNLSTPVSTANGGTGQTTLTNFGIITGRAGGAVSAISPVAVGQVLISSGTSADPAFSSTPLLTNVKLSDYSSSDNFYEESLAVSCALTWTGTGTWDTLASGAPTVTIDFYRCGNIKTMKVSRVFATVGTANISYVAIQLPTRFTCTSTAQDLVNSTQYGYNAGAGGVGFTRQRQSITDKIDVLSPAFVYTIGAYNGWDAFNLTYI